MLHNSRINIQQNLDLTLAPTKSGKAPFTISSNGVLAETFYVVFGDIYSTEKIPLVVGHGGGGTHHYLKSLSQLTEKDLIPVILYDQTGFGLSSHFPDQAGNTSFWTVSMLVEQLHELITYLGIEKRYNYLGHSFGTALGIEIAGQPALFMGLQKLILWSPIASIELANEMFKKRREMLPKEILETLKRHEADGTTDSEEYIRAMAASKHHDFCRLEVWPDDLLESLSYSSKDANAALTLFGDSPLEIKGSLQNWSALKTACDIAVPTLLLNGHYDWSDEAMEPLFWKIPIVKWVTFSNSSHLLHFEEKERFMNIVSTWLAS
ncbi:proline-specific peptidase [Dendrothele bispora CBS 962.96]|uniref:Proline-specific peptidase n=1 Tax=Dendrothele bispora (strain CBS 962.96) TaxID=1314807 RepID=A0A4S8M8C2_DENBC|nr:proline-specific peptidase [Dendrothele bispora CBS 962.96]